MQKIEKYDLAMFELLSDDVFGGKAGTVAVKGQ